MREIKFRGKRKDYNSWIYGGVVKVFGDYFIVNEDRYDYFTMKYNLDGKKVFPETVSQFTGSHDKNGKEIYEGDIVRNNRTKQVGCVVWHNGGWMIWNKLYELGEVDDFLSNWCNENWHKDTGEEIACEIIGNIHDNKELLNE